MSEAKKIYKVGISGSYGGLNLGDEAILQSMINQLRQSLPVEITVFTRDVEDTKRRHKVEHVVSARSLTRSEVVPEIEGLDLFILGGGGILFDSEIRAFLREVSLAHDNGVPVMVYAVSAGPLQDSNMQKHVKEVLSQAALITVRERDAKKTLEETGINCEIIVTADPAFLIEPELLSKDTIKRERLEPGQRLVAMSVREPGSAAPDLSEMSYHELIANTADFIIDRYNSNIVFIPMEQRVLDMQHSHAVISKMLQPQRAWLLQGEYTPGQILSLMKQFDFAVGMRLHFLIFAALQGVPFVALPYAAKVSSILEDLQIATPPLRLVNAGRLISYIDRYWDDREATKKQIRRLLPAIKERARDNNRMAVKLLTGQYEELETCSLLKQPEDVKG
ncbi:MAG: polysaccharide pyruvyl transferase family protein [Dehalococcoidales bacterium]|nr:polysaccharide pyruvyl transferase family protein [Dehalococcoidales bacterium]